MKKQMFILIVLLTIFTTQTYAQALDISGDGIIKGGTSTATFTIDSDSPNNDARLILRNGAESYTIGVDGSEQEDLLEIAAGASTVGFSMNDDGAVGLRTRPDERAFTTINGTNTRAALLLKQNNNSRPASLLFSGFGIEDVFGIQADAGSSQFGNAQMHFYYTPEEKASKYIMTMDGDLETVGIGLPIDITNTTTTFPVPEYSLSVWHAAGSPAASANTHNGLSVKNTSNNDEWTIYTRTSSDGDLQFFHNRVLRATINSANGAYTQSSDKKLKSNIKTLDNQLAKIMQLRPTTYQFKDDESATTNYGLIAQELQEVYPAMVAQIQNKKEDGQVTLGVAYTELIPVLLAGIQEQQDELTEQNDIIVAQSDKITELEERLQQIEKMLSNDSTLSIPTTDADVSITNADAPQLAQNIPNPFKGATQIQYFLPAFEQSAYLTIQNQNGQILKTIRLTTAGEGIINLSLKELPAGNYSYSLRADNQLISTKQMILTK